ncbi:MAG: ParB N-terminal domain-containing protein [Candidatus Lloydbacteria bacterium]|nr:ParB N-terminal domain-containing protein [Candidatus Lloydbacteria bacterium]
MPRIIVKNVPLEKIVLLPQMRAITEKNVEDLVENLRETRTLLNPVTVMKRNDTVWKEVCKIKDRSFQSLARYDYILVAGHRRFKAFQTLAKEDREWEEIPVQVLAIDNVDEFMRWQITENTYHPPETAEMAYAVATLWSYAEKLYGKAPTLSHFSASIGCSEDATRGYIRFVSLPKKLRKLVEDKLIPYGIAVALAKICELPEDKGGGEMNALRFANAIMIEGSGVKDAVQKISAFVFEKTSGQQALFSDGNLMLEMQEGAFAGRDKKTRQGLAFVLSFFQQTLALFKNGIIPQERLSLIKKEAACDLLKTVGLLETLLPIVKETLSPKEQTRTKTVLAESKKALSKIIKKK